MNKVSACLSNNEPTIKFRKGGYLQDSEGNYYICTKVKGKWVIVELNRGIGYSYQRDSYDWPGWETLPSGYCVKIEVG